MASVGQGIALGAAAASFRKADERRIDREAITSTARTATLDRQARSDLADRLISEKERKDILENVRASHQILLTERRRLKNLRATLDPNDPNDAAAIHKIQNNLAALDKQLVTVANAIGPGENGNSILSNPAAFAALGTADQASQEFQATPRAVSAAEGLDTGTAAAAAGPGKAVAAGQKKAQELKAVSDFMQDTLRKAGLPPEVAEAQANDPVVTEAVQNPVEGGEPVSDDMREYARRIAMARAFGAAGMTEQGRFQLAIADSILENSPSIRLNRELDKLAGPALTQLAGTDVGLTVRQVRDELKKAGAKLPTPRELARDRSLGTKSVEAEEMVSFVDEADIIIRGVLDEFEGKGEFLGKENPNILGVLGGLFSGAQTFLAVMSDLKVTSLVDEARDLALNSELTLEEVDALFDSETLSVLNLIEHSVGMIIARLRSSESRLLARVVNDAMEDAKLTGLKGGKQIAAKLKRISRQLGRRKASLQRRFDLGGDASTGQSGITELHFENGALVDQDGNVFKPGAAP